MHCTMLLEASATLAGLQRRTRTRCSFFFLGSCDVGGVTLPELQHVQRHDCSSCCGCTLLAQRPLCRCQLELQPLLLPARWRRARIKDACACACQVRRFVGRGVPAKVAAAAAGAWLELAHVDENCEFEYAPLVDRAALVYRPGWALECFQLACMAKALQRVRRRARRQREQALALAAAHRTRALLRATVLGWRHAVAERCAVRCRSELPRPGAVAISNLIWQRFSSCGMTTKTDALFTCRPLAVTAAATYLIQAFKEIRLIAVWFAMFLQPACSAV